MTNLTSLTDRQAARRGERDTEALVAAAAAGEPVAWKQLIDRYAVLIRSVCRSHRLCDADADDVAQLTWLRAVEHIGRLRDPDRFGAWIGTTARHECLAVLRGRKRVVPTADEIAQPLYAAHADADETELAAERRDAVRNALAALPPRQQTLLRLLHADSEPSYDEIGSALDMPVGSIGPTRGRALERLRRELQHAPRSAA
jgi:RNA polymerase sigma factor (sigma-70 family)